MCHIAEHGKYDESSEETGQAVHAACDNGVSANQNTQLVGVEMISSYKHRTLPSVWVRWEMYFLG
jgi:hypothetical protein